MTGAPEPAVDDRRGCVLVGNWMLIGLGVACVSSHVGAVWSLWNADTTPDALSRLGAWILAVPSVLIGVALGIAAASRRVVPRPVRRIELGLLVLIAAGTVIEFLCAT